MHRVWRRLRAEAPAYLHPENEQGPTFWVLSRHDDIRSLYQDAERYTSMPGNMLLSLQKLGGDPAAGQTLALSDPPRHHALRSALLKAFSPRIRELVVNRLQARVTDLIRGTIGRGPLDFGTEVAQKVSMGTICDLLGFPAKDHEFLAGLSREVLGSDRPHQSEEAEWVSRSELLLYCQEFVEARTAAPADDLVSAMVASEVDGVALSLAEVLLNCYGFVLAGDQTSRLAILGALVAFTQFPEQWEALRDGRVEVSAAVDEVLRWTSPVQHVARTTLTDVQIAGCHIPAGNIVTGWNTSANRDESAFAQPDVFDLSRSPNPHMSLGLGVHYCFGAYLGRAEVGAVLSTLAAEVRSITSGGVPEPLYSTFLNGYSSVKVALD